MLRTCLGLLLALLVGACGDSPLRRGPPVPDVPVQSKPNALLGGLVAQVVERPAPDEARVEARFGAAAGASGCVVDLILPEGAFLVSGAERMVPASPDAPMVWVVRFPTDRTLDLVLRACGTTPEGMQATELSLRLVNAPSGD